MTRSPTRNHEIGGLVPVATAAAAALCSLALYVYTMPPTITWWFGGADSAELAAAVGRHGVPHPTGYPLFLMLGQAATRLPFGDVAARINAMNALFASLAVGGIVLIVSTVSGGMGGRGSRAIAALLAAMAVATSSLFWSQAIIGEVYALHVALTVATCIVWVRPRVHPAMRGAIHGLALANHLTSVIPLVAALVAFTPPWRRWEHEQRRAILPFLLGLGAMLTIYAILPLRAVQDPPINWGDPDSPGRLLAHVTGQQYRHLFTPADLTGSLRRIAALSRFVLGDLPPWMLPAAALGMWRIQRDRPDHARFTGLIAAGVMLFAGMYRAPDRNAYLLPLYVVLSIWSGVGLLVAAGAVTRWRGGGAGSRLLVAAAAVATVAALIVWAVGAGKRVNLHDDDSAVVFARTTLMSLPPDATYASARDDVSFALWYAQFVLGVRQDVHVVDLRNPSLPGGR